MKNLAKKIIGYINYSNGVLRKKMYRISLVIQASSERPKLASRVPLFLLGDFPFNECKCLNFAYKSKTVRASFVKFRQQFEINKTIVGTKFRGNRYGDFGFRAHKPPQRFGMKDSLTHKRRSYGKNISDDYMP